MSTDAKLKITQPERLLRILQRLCNANMRGILRVKARKNLAIRCVFSFVDVLGSEKRLGFTEISAEGLANLKDQSSVQVEVVGLPFKLTFSATIRVVRETGIIVKFPPVLQSLERREKQRFPVVDGLTPFLKLSCWQPDYDALDNPPVFSQFEHLGSWLPIADISVSGASVLCRFPSVLNSVFQGFFDPKAQLILPMGQVLETPVNFRWVRRIKTRVQNKHPGTYNHMFRFGVEFYRLTPETLSVIEQLLRKLSIADAI